MLRNDMERQVRREDIVVGDIIRFCFASLVLFLLSIFFFFFSLKLYHSFYAPTAAWTRVICLGTCPPTLSCSTATKTCTSGVSPVTSRIYLRFNSTQLFVPQPGLAHRRDRRHSQSARVTSGCADPLQFALFLQASRLFLFHVPCALTRTDKQLKQAISARRNVFGRYLSALHFTHSPVILCVCAGVCSSKWRNTESLDNFVAHLRLGWAIFLFLKVS